MESYFSPDGGGYHHHHSHFNNKKGAAACRIHEPPEVTKAEEAEAGSELGTGGSTAQARDHEAEVPPPAALWASLHSRQFSVSAVPGASQAVGIRKRNPLRSQHRSWPGELGEPLHKEQDALFSGWVSALPGHVGFRPTQPLAVPRAEMKSAPPSA